MHPIEHIWNMLMLKIYKHTFSFQFENRCNFRVLSGKFLRQKSCYLESFCFFWLWPYFCISSPCGSSIALCALIMVIMTLEAIPWSTLVPIAFLSPEWLFQLITTSLIPLEMTKKYSENGITQNFLCFPEPIPIYTLVPNTGALTQSLTGGLDPYRPDMKETRQCCFG